MGTDETIEILNVTPGAKPTRISKRKYELTRRVLLELIPRTEKGIAFRDLPRLVEPRLTADMKPAKGSASWLTTAVKLDLEARGLIERVPGVAPQRLRRTR